MAGTSSISYQITKAVVTPPLKAAVEMTDSSQIAEPQGSHSTHKQDLLKFPLARAACALQCPDSKASLKPPTFSRNHSEVRHKEVTLQVWAKVLGTPARSHILNHMQKTGGDRDRLTQREWEWISRGASGCPDPGDGGQTCGHLYQGPRQMGPVVACCW